MGKIIKQKPGEVSHYTYRVTWSSEDQEYAGLCAEFPSLSHLDSTQEKAMQGIINLVKDVVEDMKSTGEEIPEAFAEKPFSGKFQLRVTPEKHRMLAIEAAEAGVSLNRLVSGKL